MSSAKVRRITFEYVRLSFGRREVDQSAVSGNHETGRRSCRCRSAGASPAATTRSKARAPVRHRTTSRTLGARTVVPEVPKGLEELGGKGTDLCEIFAPQKHRDRRVLIDTAENVT